jgi:hypothetical protein
MADVVFPTGIFSHAIFNAPDVTKTPAPPSPIPIPYPDTARFEKPPGQSVVLELFGPGDIEVLGVVPLSTDFHGL